MQNKKDLEITTIWPYDQTETFSRMLLIQRRRNVDLRDVLEYKLGTLPLPLSNYDATLIKPQKSKLFQQLESSISRCNNGPENCPKIFDGMVYCKGGRQY